MMAASPDLSSDDDCHSILGVTPSDSLATVREAFKKQASSLHPDVNASPDAAVQFRKLVAAYEV